MGMVSSHVTSMPIWLMPAPPRQGRFYRCSGGMDDGDLVSIELEALEVTYGESLEVLTREPLRVSLCCTPFTGEDDNKQFVRVDLLMAHTDRYPEALPDIQVLNCKGTPSILYTSYSDH